MSPVTLLCTLGCNVVRYGVSGFMTNSHCSNVEGAEETPPDYHQNRQSHGAPDLIGTELDDRMDESAQSRLPAAARLPL